MKIITVLGARPQFIKAAALSAKVTLLSDIEEIIIHTGQHFDSNMSDVFFEELKIPEPKYNLGINNLSHGAMTGRMLERIEEILIIEKPDYLVVYGDTNSTLAGALSAQKLHIPVAHIEAGLRSYNNRMPEEINRVLTDKLSSILFCPSILAQQNLIKEGITDQNSNVVITGDIMKDSMELFKKYSRAPEQSLPKQFILATLHRQENTDDIKRLQQILLAYNEISKEIPIVLPIHPRTKNILEKNTDISFNKRDIILIPPVSYWNMLYLLDKAIMVITDSGGLQKEAYFSNKYCITTRDETEWVELVEAGVNFIASADKNKILSGFNLFNKRKFNATQNIYGNGEATEIIIENLKNK